MSAFGFCLLIMFGVPALGFLPVIFNAYDRYKVYERQEQERIAMEKEKAMRAKAKEQKLQESIAANAQKAKEAERRKAEREEKQRMKLEKARELAELAERKLAAEQALQDLQATPKNHFVYDQQVARPMVVLKSLPCVDDTDEEAKQVDSAAFEGEVLSFTGVVPNKTRSRCMKLTEYAGGKAYERINTQCTILVVGAKPGKQQMERAEKWGTRCMSWEEWQERIGLTA